jgi:hypothetical protein
MGCTIGLGFSVAFLGESIASLALVVAAMTYEKRKVPASSDFLKNCNLK